MLAASLCEYEHIYGHNRRGSRQLTHHRASRPRPRCFARCTDRAAWLDEHGIAFRSGGPAAGNAGGR
jgi:hypothetical protein